MFFHMILYGCHMIFHGFHMILYEFHMVLYEFHSVLTCLYNVSSQGLRSEHDHPALQFPMCFHPMSLSGGASITLSGGGVIGTHARHPPRGANLPL